MTYTNIHAHTHYSNIRLKDSINTPKSLIDTSIKKGLKGVAITDHGCISGHYDFWSYYNKLKKENKLPEGFKIILGDEIYLVDKDKERQAIDKKEKFSYNHFIVIAKDDIGVKAIREISTKEWKNEHYYRGMQRVATYKDELLKIMGKYKGHVIASTACLGGELPQLLLEYNKTKENKVWEEIDTFVKYMIEVFGKENCFFELQPSNHEEQKIVNKMFETLSNHYQIPMIVTTDAHYGEKRDRPAHKAFLESQDGEREVDYFYETTYVMSHEELLEYFEPELLKKLEANTNLIYNEIKEYNLNNGTIIPKAILPDWNWEPEKYKYKVKDYPNIVKMIDSEYDEDHYYIKLVLDGIDSHNDTDWTDEVLSRIDLECSELIGLTDQLKQPMSSYFLLMKDFIDIMWTVSLVGPARGSASCWLTNYLIGITQVNSLTYNLPHWRFLTKERIGSFPDIDVDSESSKKEEIIAKIKDKYGEDCVLNVATFGTQKTMRVIDDTCRAFGMSPDERANFKNLVPRYGLDIPSIDELFNSENDFRRKVESVPGLKEAMEKASGLISSRGQHASGVILFPQDYTNYNAMMKAPSGTPTTQYDLHQSEAMGAIKFDFLSISALDKIRAAMDILLEQGKIAWQGSLKATYDKYFSIDNINLNNKDIYDELKSGKVISAFQFDKDAGRLALNKIDCKNFDELCAANSLMRLHTNTSEQLIDRYIRFKNEPKDQEDYMDGYNLTSEEKTIIHSLLDERYGVCDTQEYIMMILMDKRLSNYNIIEANSFRKIIAGKKKDNIDSAKIKFFEKMKENNNSENLSNYIWNELFVPTFGYAFSLPHIVAYTFITVIEANLSLTYGSNIWQSAVLNVDSGILDESSSNLAKISKTVQKYKSIILPPDINLSHLGFYPKKDKILYGIKPVVSLNYDDAKFIIDNRPYKSLDDFYDKCVENGILTDRKVINLIKAGMFNEFGEKRKLMTEFIKKISPECTRVSKVSTKKLYNYLPEKLKDEAQLYISFDLIKKTPSDELINELSELYNKFNINLINYYDGNKFDTKSIKKEIDKNIPNLSNWFKTDEAKIAKTNYDRAQLWNKYCTGTNENWEFDSLNTYIGNSYTSKINYNIKIDELKDIPEEPEIIGKNKRGYNIYKEYAITGTVIDNNSSKNIITLITDSGIIDVKVRSYKYYNERITKQIKTLTGKVEKKTIDNSWCAKGNNLIAIGYIRNGYFYCSHRNHLINHSLVKIIGNDSDNNAILKYTKSE